MGLAAFAIGVGCANRFIPERITLVDDGSEAEVRTITLRQVSCVGEELEPSSLAELINRLAKLEERRDKLRERLAKLNRRLAETKDEDNLLSASADLVIQLDVITKELDRLYDSAYGDGTTKLLYRQRCYEY